VEKADVVVMSEEVAADLVFNALDCHASPSQMIFRRLALEIV
jgi:hypothetical protein